MLPKDFTSPVLKGLSQDTKGPTFLTQYRLHQADGKIYLHNHMYMERSNSSLRTLCRLDLKTGGFLDYQADLYGNEKLEIFRNSDHVIHISKHKEESVIKEDLFSPAKEFLVFAPYCYAEIQYLIWKYAKATSSGEIPMLHFLSLSTFDLDSMDFSFKCDLESNLIRFRNSHFGPYGVQSEPYDVFIDQQTFAIKKILVTRRDTSLEAIEHDEILDPNISPLLMEPDHLHKSTEMTDGLSIDFSEEEMPWVQVKEKAKKTSNQVIFIDFLQSNPKVLYPCSHWRRSLIHNSITSGYCFSFIQDTAVFSQISPEKQPLKLEPLDFREIELEVRSHLTKLAQHSRNIIIILKGLNCLFLKMIADTCPTATVVLVQPITKFSFEESTVNSESPELKLLLNYPSVDTLENAQISIRKLCILGKRISENLKQLPHSFQEFFVEAATKEDTFDSLTRILQETKTS